MLLWLFFAVATLLATAAVVWPLLSARPAATADAHDDERRRLAVVRDRKHEIERERAAGRLSDGDAEQAQADLLRQMAEDFPDSASAPDSAGAAAGSRLAPGLTALALAVSVPVLALLVYQQVGAPELASTDLRGSDRPVDAAEMDRLVAEVEKRVRDNPQDGEAWAVLAEARRMQGRHADAVSAFEQAARRLPPDARLLADFAESAALVAGGDFSGRPIELLEQALAANANEPRAIALMGAAQYRLGNLERARGYLAQMQAGLRAGSEEATHIGEVLARIDAEIAQRGGAATTAPSAADAATTTVTGTVTVAANLAEQARRGGTLFVIARQAGGPPIPVAVVRQQAAELPMRFSIGDANAMDRSRLLSSAGTLVLEARLSRSGNAMREP
ncbi:MAG: c-type cytochrome biogenesis protein CcmI, partial [Burkholderiales bacterium]